MPLRLLQLPPLVQIEVVDLVLVIAVLTEQGLEHHLESHLIQNIRLPYPQAE